MTCRYNSKIKCYYFEWSGFRWWFEEHSPHCLCWKWTLNSDCSLNVFLVRSHDWTHLTKTTSSRAHFTASKDIPRGSKQKVHLIPVCSNDQEWVFKPECRKVADHSCGELCQLATVTSVARPDVDTTEPVLCELVPFRFEPTSSFGSKFPFNLAHDVVRLWGRWFKWCKINVINFCFS